MSERYSSWDSHGMEPGQMYRYLRQGRTLYSSEMVNDPQYLGFDHVIGEVNKEHIIVFLDRIVFETKYESLGTPVTNVITLIKVLTGNGIIGWLYWNVGDWERVESNVSDVF